MKLFWKFLFLILFLINIFLSSWYVLHGDIFFTADIARDFHLLRELNEKKIILIGPRSSGELYHGPLWAYLNYPAFFIGKGNPVVVGWYWVILAIIGTIINYQVAKRLFNRQVAIAFALMISLYITFHTRAFSHPHADMFLIPVWFFCFVRYFRTGRLRYLVSHILLSGALVQFELAPGMALTLLSMPALIILILKRKAYRHLTVLALLPIALGNFFIFDFRHDHLLWQKLLGFVTPHTGEGFFDYTFYIKNRVLLFFTSTEILRRDPGFRNIGLFVLLIILTILQIKQKKHIDIYLWFFYFYTGFFVVSFIDKGPILYFHLYPLFLFVFLIFCSFFTSSYKKIFTIIFAVIYVMNLVSSIGDVNDAQGFIGKSKVSWKFLKNISQTVFSGPEKDFGYFVYSPDILGYEPKYAMFYMQTRYPKKHAYSFQKKAVTYLIAAPHPPADPFMKDEWWRIHQVNIKREPDAVVRFDNGYKIEKFYLSAEEQKVYFDPAIDPGLIFR